MGVPLLLGRILPLGKAYSLLRDISKPSNANEPESIPDVLYDTQTYAQAGQTSLTFFNSATAANASDITLSNFSTGVLETGYFFEVHRIFLILHAIPNLNVTAVVTGAANDVELIHKTARGVIYSNMNGKTYGPHPLAFYGRPGGPAVSYVGFGSGTAANNILTVGENEANGGFPYLGNLVIPEQKNFKTTITFAAVQAISAATNLTVAMMGVKHRPVA